jgi:hypothetical protein
MYDIFISYAREDINFAKELATDLEKEGFSVWWDISIPAGKTFDQVIEDAIKAAKCVIVLWSSYSTKSNWVRIEAEEGRTRGNLVPVLIEEVEIPFAFKNIQAANLSNWNKNHLSPEFQKLVADIKLVLGNTNSDRSEPEKIFPRKESYVPKPGADSGFIKFINKWKYLIISLIVIVLIGLYLISKPVRVKGPVLIKDTSGSRIYDPSRNTEEIARTDSNKNGTKGNNINESCNPTYGLEGYPNVPNTGEILLFSGSSSAQGAKVYLDGMCQTRMLKRDNNAILLLTNIPQNKYVIRISQDGFQDYQSNVDIVSRQRSTVNFDLIKN